MTHINIDSEFLSNYIDESGTMYPTRTAREMVYKPESATDGRNIENSYCYCKEELGGEMVH